MFRKSSSSNPTGNCVEVDCDGEPILVRHSRDPEGPVLAFTRQEWIAFHVGMYAGEFLPPVE